MRSAAARDDRLSATMRQVFAKEEKKKKKKKKKERKKKRKSSGEMRRVLPVER
jgi:hypothetical protein